VYQKANPAYPRFYNGGVHVVARGPGGLKSPYGVQGQSPGRGPGDEFSQKNNVKLVYNF